VTTHESIDPSSHCPGVLMPISTRGSYGWEHRGRYRCDVCGYRTTRYPDGVWTLANPLSPLQRERIARANKLDNDARQAVERIRECAELLAASHWGETAHDLAVAAADIERVLRASDAVSVTAPEGRQKPCKSLP
jgi:hypothetical protein